MTRRSPGHRAANTVLLSLLVVPALAACALAAAVLRAGSVDWPVPVPHTAMRVERVQFVGATAFTEARLAKVVGIGRGETLAFPATMAPQDAMPVQERLARLERFYRDHGYPNAHVVRAEFDVHQGFGRVSLVVVVAEGEPGVVQLV